MTPVREALAAAIERLQTIQSDTGCQLDGDFTKPENGFIARLQAALSAAPGEPCAWLRDLQPSAEDEALAVCIKGDPGAFPVYRSPQPAAGWDEAIEAAAKVARLKYAGSNLHSIGNNISDDIRTLRREAPAPAEGKGTSVTEDQIKHMVDRFLGWTLPANFNPDGGVSFKRLENRYHHPDAPPFYPMPIGTNLFDAIQATEMVHYMIDGLSARPDTAEARLRVALEECQATATRAEQQRNEAYERAAKEADQAASDFMAGGLLDPSVHIARKVSQHIAAAIRRLAPIR